MNHMFTPSFADPLICGRCKKSPIDHSDRATCECCSNTGVMELYVDMLMCSTCIENEKATLEANNTPEKQQARVDAHNTAIRENSLRSNEPSGVLNISNLVDTARKQDMTIQVREDIFSAATVAYNAVYASIDSDSAITSKQYAKTEFTLERVKYFQQVIFDANQKIMEAQNHLRVLQTEKVKLVATLREEERQKLGLLTPEYKPTKPTTPKSKPRTVKRPTYDRAELAKEVDVLIKDGYPATLAGIQGILTARDMTPKQAAGYFRTLVDSMKAKQAQ